MWLKNKVQKTVSTLRFCAKNISKISSYCFIVRIFHTQAVHKHYTGHFIMFSVITNIYNKKTQGPTLMEFLIATGKLKKFFF